MQIPIDADLRDDLRKPERFISPNGRVSIAATRNGTCRSFLEPCPRHQRRPIAHAKTAGIPFMAPQMPPTHRPVMIQSLQ
jgi:hypothetical protein